MRLSKRLALERCGMMDEAIIEVKKLESHIRKLEKENFKLSAGQCVIGDGIISGEYGHAICPKEYNK